MQKQKGKKVRKLGLHDRRDSEDRAQKVQGRHDFLRSEKRSATIPTRKGEIIHAIPVDGIGKGDLCRRKTL
jgi:hypothetical protein